MARQELIDYIRQNLADGANAEQIKKSLSAIGWPAVDINEAYYAVSAPTQLKPKPVPQTVTTKPAAVFSNLFGRSFSIYKNQFKTLLAITALPTLISTLGVFIVGFLSASAPSRLPSPNTAAGFLSLIAVSALVGSILIWGQASLLYAIKDKTGIMESFQRGLDKVGSMWWVAILSLFAIMGGNILLFVPGTILSLSLSLSLVVLINEDAKGMDALLKSYEYIKGRWWPVFWKFFFLGLAMIASLLIPAGIIAAAKNIFLNEVFNFACGLFVTPFVLIYTTLIYADLKAEKGEVQSSSDRTWLVAISVLGALAIAALAALVVGMLAFSKPSPSPRLDNQKSAGSSALPNLLDGIRVETTNFNARDMKRIADIRQLSIAVEMYYADENKLPATLDELYPKYISMNLTDPSTKEKYDYTRRPNLTDYSICAVMESSGEKQCVSSLSQQ